MKFDVDQYYYERIVKNLEERIKFLTSKMWRCNEQETKSSLEQEIHKLDAEWYSKLCKYTDYIHHKIR